MVPSFQFPSPFHVNVEGTSVAKPKSFNSRARKRGGSTGYVVLEVCTCDGGGRTHGSCPTWKREDDDGVRRVAKNEDGSNVDVALSAGVERRIIPMVLAGILHSQRAGTTHLFLVPPRDSNWCSVLSRQHIVRVAEPKGVYIWMQGTSK